MHDDRDIQRYFSGPVYRLLSGAFGLFLLGVGVYAMFFGVVAAPVRIGVGLLIAVLGAETLWSAVRSRQSWLARFGPFI